MATRLVHEIVYLTVAQAAELASVTAATVRSWIREGHLTEHRAGRLLRVDRAELIALMATGASASERVDIEARARAIMASAASGTTRTRTRK